MARRGLPGRHPSGVQYAQLRLANLAPANPQNLILGRRHLGMGGSSLQWPVAHDALPLPLVRQVY